MCCHTYAPVARTRWTASRLSGFHLCLAAREASPTGFPFIGGRCLQTFCWPRFLPLRSASFGRRFGEVICETVTLNDHRTAAIIADVVCGSILPSCKGPPA